MKTLDYPWGKEEILWGFDVSHKYTLKILCPKVGRGGCLSLQEHRYKDESWVVLSGKAWCLYVIEDTLYTRILKTGDNVNLPAGTIHRLMGLTEDCRILETSTLEGNAADEHIIKDTVRYACVYGRPCEKIPDTLPALKLAVKRSIVLTDEAIEDIEMGRSPWEEKSKLTSHRVKA